MASKLPRTPMPCQDPSVRAHNFNEVATGYTYEMAKDEASRCLNCKNPLCRTGCPVEVRIPEFIHAITEDKLDEAYEIIKSTNALPAVCGRVCPQEKQCEGSCVLGKKGDPVAIGRLERFVADAALAKNVMPAEPALHDPEVKVACIGSGPSSLTCAGYLAARGAKVTVFEGLHEPGGVLVYGIPSFRLPKDVVHKELDALRAQHVDIRTNWVGGKTVTVQRLFEQGYKAVFVGVGAGLPIFLNVPGESSIGVFSANEYLTRSNLGRAYAFPEYDTPNYPGRRVTVFGAGNVAMDAARTALRNGAESVKIMYRRSRAEMPARGEEIEHAMEEGVQLVE
ncbi:MAG: FAD-dependent oxidoreductase, partial [Mailhella sp.]|nr:FAD-dependent oxidoreductase [Mailhella sp.]